MEYVLSADFYIHMENPALVRSLGKPTCQIPDVPANHMRVVKYHAGGFIYPVVVSVDRWKKVIGRYGSSIPEAFSVNCGLVNELFRCDSHLTLG